MYKIRIESFEGPLHLLLQLIEQEKFDISKISLAKVTDQYLGYLDKVKKKNPEEMADFLVVATKLILIKSKSLLPNLTFNLEEDESNLEAQLKMYKEFLTAAENIKKIIEKNNFGFSRNKLHHCKNIFSPPKNLKKEKLSKIFYEIILSIKPILKLPEQAIKKAISIQEKIDYIHNLIKQKNSFIFNMILKKNYNKPEIIVSFLALLELTKQKFVIASQERIFDDIRVGRFK